MKTTFVVTAGAHPLLAFDSAEEADFSKAVVADAVGDAMLVRVVEVPLIQPDSETDSAVPESDSEPLSFFDTTTD